MDGTWLHEPEVQRGALSNDVTRMSYGCCSFRGVWGSQCDVRSITDLDLSSKPGSFRNSLGRQNSAALENLLCLNPVLSKLSLRGNGLGIAGGYRSQNLRKAAT
eukprot:4837270-Amphidinium_carterae.2